MTTQQANVIQQATERGLITINDKSYQPTILIGIDQNYVAFNDSAKTVQQAMGGYFCVGESDVYTAFPKAWLIDRKAIDRIGKVSSPARVIVIDSL